MIVRKKKKKDKIACYQMNKITRKVEKKSKQTNKEERQRLLGKK